LSAHHHALRVAAEFLRMIAHPFERLDEIENADVARARVVAPAQPRKIQMPEDVEPMIDRDDDHIAAMTQARAVVERARSAAAAEFAAMEIHHDRPLAAVAQARRPHVQNETILTDSLRRAGLRAGRAVLERVTHTAP